ncbi:MAG: beta-ketoacyl synthase N-terminal-like domain-containing protein, partial [Tissierellia bacterium]|nr:beta-ketoacyl synthase N-terminal-like domain-containing protein [Tissierellia bacterium]
MMKRVVVTGLGLKSPIGNNYDEIINSLKTSYCSIDKITSYNTDDREVSLASEIKDFVPEDYIDKKLIRRLDRVNQLGIAAATEALKDSGLDKINFNRNRTGVYISSGIGGLETIEREHNRGIKRGYDKISPFFIPMSITNLTAADIAITLELHGSCQCPVTACAGSTDAIGQAYRAIKHGYEDIIF